MIRALLILAIATFAMPAYAAQISREAKAIDSTIVRIGEQSVLLFGVAVDRPYVWPPIRGARLRMPNHQPQLLSEGKP
jgi:hypothetical protein